MQQQSAVPARNASSLKPTADIKRGQSKSAERQTHSKSADMKKEPMKAVSGIKKSKSNEIAGDKDYLKKMDSDRSRSREKKVSVGKLAKSKSPDVKPAPTVKIDKDVTSMKQSATKVVKSNSAEIKTNKIIKSSSSESNKAKTTLSFQQKKSESNPVLAKGLSKSGSGEPCENKAVYAKVSKATKTPSEKVEVKEQVRRCRF